MVKSVFFSFSSKDAGWVRQFRGEEYFVRPLGLLAIEDYTAPGKALAFGFLDNWLTDKVTDCAAIFIFLSNHYLESRASKLEFDAAMARMLEKKIILVPVMLDVAGKSYWAELKADETYKDTLAGYQYADFTMAGRPRNIFTGGQEELDVTRQIRSLAETVAATIALQAERAPADPGGQVVAQAPEPAVDAGLRPDRKNGNLVLLGDPTHPTPDVEVAANFAALSRILSDAGVDHEEWPHAWRKQKMDGEQRLKPPATFLRIVTPLDIKDEAEAPRTLQWINESGRVDGQIDGEVVLWHPSDETINWPLQTPKLRRDSVEALAEWLRTNFKQKPGEPLPLLLIIDEPQYDAVEDTPYWDVVRMVSELANIKFPGRSMNAEEFNRFIVDTQHQRLIIAILDNNVNMTVQDGNGPIERFEEIVERWQDEIADINSERTVPIEAMWVAVMTRLAHLNPLSTWNKRTLEPIHVLRVSREKNEAGKPSYAPDEPSKMRVSYFLKRWITGQ